MIYSSYMIMKHYACLICTYNLFSTNLNNIKILTLHCYCVLGSLMAQVSKLHR